MKTSKLFIVVTVLTAFAFIAGVQAEVSIDEAVKIGKQNFKDLVDQSYHYKIEYDTVIALPVHSKTIRKSDFYLLYFLKGDVFQAEMEVDRETGKATILSVELMSPPYHELLEGTFAHKYFSPDSISGLAERRFRVPPDSVRLVYFGVIPRLGKRGVLWEIFSRVGKSYINLDGPTVTMEQVVRDLNTSQRQEGNYTADSIRLVEIVAEIKRLEAMTSSEREHFDLTPEKIDSIKVEREQEMEGIYKTFTDLRGKVNLGKEHKVP